MFKDSQFVFTTAWKLGKIYEKSLIEIGSQWSLTQCEMDILLFLYTNGSWSTAKDIADYRCISKSLVCKSASTLNRKGLLYSSTDDYDGRVVRLHLTDDGRIVSEQIQLACDNMCLMLGSGITKTEWRMLSSVFSRMIQNTGTISDLKPEQ